MSRTTWGGAAISISVVIILVFYIYVFFDMDSSSLEMTEMFAFERRLDDVYI